MNSFFKWRPFLLGFLYMLAGSAPVWADDTEIYFGSGTIGTRNNILFVIDTSGSMDTVDSGNSTTRMAQLKVAFRDLLGKLDNVNVGIMRFNNPGGPVLYPVTNINTPVTEGVGTLTQTLQATGDDGVERTSNTKVDLSNTNLSLGTTIISGTVPYSFRQRILVGTDDASSDLTNTDNSGTDLANGQLIRRGSDGERVIGLRFSNVTIPKSATTVIDSANLILTTSDTGGTMPISTTITGEKAIGGATFGRDSSSRPLNRSASDKVFTGGVNWEIAGEPAIDTVLTSPDIKSIVSSMVGDSAWASGKSMAFFYKRNSSASTSGRANFYSADSSDASEQAPVLTVNYHTGTGPAVTADVTTAMRFSGVSIPRGATITGAYLEFTASNPSTTAASLAISAEKVGNSAALVATDANISLRTSRTETVPWNSTTVPALGNWTAWSTYATPELKTIVQDIVSQSTWCGGNAMTFFITGSGNRTVSSRDEASNTAPRLVVTYDPTSVPQDGTSCLQASFTRQISAGSDDAEEDDAAAANLTRGTLSLAAGGGTKVRRVGLRFANVRIPKTAQILSAYMQFRASTDYTSSPPALSLSINGQAVADAPTFVSATYNIRDRAKTAATIPWSVPSTTSWVQNGTYDSPDIGPIVQELVNQNGWAVGNDMAFIISGSSTTALRQVHSYNSSSGTGYAPRLVINYVDNGTTGLRTVRHVLMDQVQALQPNGNTPLQDTFYEAVQYFRGEPVDYGKKRGNGYTYARVSHPDSMVPGSYTSITPAGCKDSNSSGCKTETINGSPIYKSPISYACQSNHIVLLTDGLPNSDHSKDKIHALPGFPSANCSFKDAGECVPELATWVNKTADISVGGTGSANLAGQQTLVVDTIAFYQDADGNEFLSNTATNGGGLHLAASSGEALAEALEKISIGAISENASFVAAGAAVNAFDRTQNRDDLYFSVFKPQKTPRWPGNLKKYKLGYVDDPSTTEDTKVPLVLDANNNPAVDPATGFFKDDSKSYWSVAADGPDVTKGGAGALINNWENRSLYSNVGPSAILSLGGNALARTNTFANKAAFGVTAWSDAAFADLVDWTRGKDVKNEDSNTATTTRFVMADPLHSRPVAITYKGTDDDPDITVFVASNSGTLHAINNTTGQELFGFIPKELLPLQTTLYENVESNEHPYGLDGSITTWVIDPDGDGLVLNSNGTLQTGNKVILVVGMGRGGRNYYALDVTDRAQPKLLWTIRGGVTTGFEQLGQTWSQPEKALVKISGETAPRRVLLFGGGYDTTQDNNSVRTPDSAGAAVYMVDLNTGALVWSAGGDDEHGYDLVRADMKYGIPAQLSGADLTGDGLADVFFVGDMGGQVWRFDINNGSTAANLVSGDVIADLGVASGANTAANNRRFYHAPSFFLGKNNGTPYLGVVIGSGYRGHPLSEDTNDMFFMIRQSSIFSAPASYTKVELASLMDITDNVIGEGSEAQRTAAQATLSSKQGWYLRLTNSGEKVLSTPLVQNGEVYFTTYEPSTSIDQTNPCMPQTGTNRVYQMFVVDAQPSRTIVGTPVAADRATILKMGGIASDPISNPTKDGPATVQVGTGFPPPKDGAWTKPKRIYWYENRTR